MINQPEWSQNQDWNTNDFIIIAIVKIDAVSATCTLQNAYYLPCIYETSNFFRNPLCSLEKNFHNIIDNIIIYIVSYLKNHIKKIII